jgi:hypothetical protein
MPQAQAGAIGAAEVDLWAICRKNRLIREKTVRKPCRIGFVCPMNRFMGVLIGFCTLLIIGLFHPYHFGTGIWPLFLGAGLACAGASILVASPLVSALLGILGFTLFWSIRELFEQRERVRQGRFPKNPRRTADR